MARMDVHNAVFGRTDAKVVGGINVTLPAAHAGWILGC